MYTEEECFMASSVSRRVAWLFPLTLALAGCDMSLGHLTGRATDEWTHHYSLSPGGEIRIVNTNGKIDVEGVDGTDLEVRAERIARAATDAGASELLPRISIKEEVSPGRVSIETERMSGLMIGAAFEVRYHVRAPRNAIVNITNTNGMIALTALGGKVSARTTNGGVNAKGLTGGLEARTTNGGLNIDLASTGPEKISMQTTNGGVTVTLPDTVKADLSASWTNGGISVSPDLKVAVSEKSRRRFEGRMNGGGTPIDLHTTNGGIRVRPRNSDSERGQSY
jgi:putative adhesin